MTTRYLDPFEGFDRLMASATGRARGGLMPMDAFERDGVYTLRFDLPGVDSDQVDVTVENNLLIVTAERPVEETENATWLIRERPAGSHRREVRLGNDLDSTRVNASYDNGVLTVKIPVREEAKPYRVTISRQGSGVTTPARCQYMSAR